jgi:hypothetical protein
MTQQIAVSALLANLQKHAKVTVVETRTLADGTQVRILVGTLQIFPNSARPTWYPLVLRPKQQEVDRREVEAILRHFWNAQLDFFSGKVVNTPKPLLNADKSH